jgi:hypothetical protein
MFAKVSLWARPESAAQAIRARATRPARCEHDTPRCWRRGGSVAQVPERTYAREARGSDLPGAALAFERDHFGQTNSKFANKIGEREVATAATKHGGTAGGLRFGSPRRHRSISNTAQQPGRLLDDRPGIVVDAADPRRDFLGRCDLDDEPRRRASNRALALPSSFSNAVALGMMPIAVPSRGANCRASSRGTMVGWPGKIGAEEASDQAPVQVLAAARRRRDRQSDPLAAEIDLLGERWCAEAGRCGCVEPQDDQHADGAGAGHVRDSRRRADTPVGWHNSIKPRKITPRSKLWKQTPSRT